jgi:hypothetical protein
MHLAQWRWRNKRGERWWVSPSQRKNLILLKNSNVHSFVDGGSISQEHDIAEILDPYDVREASKVQIQKTGFPIL